MNCIWICLFNWILLCINVYSFPNNQTPTKIVSFPLYPTSKSFLITVTFCSDERQQIWYFDLNTQLDFLITIHESLSEQHEPKEIKKLSSTTLDFFGTKLNAEYNEVTQWSLPPLNEMFKKFNFYSLVDYNEKSIPYFITHNNYLNAIPLSYNSMKNSILKTLKDKKVISHKTFILALESRYEGGKKSRLILGENNNNYVMGKKYKYTVPIEENEWKCRLNKIIVNSNEFPYYLTNLNKNITYMIIQSGSNVVYAPETFFNFLIDFVFNPYIKDGSCKLNENKSNIRCYTYHISEIPPVTFVIGNKQFVLTFSDLFDDNDFTSYYLIEKNPYNNNFIVGLPFLEKYTTFFDVDDNSMTFYSTTPIEEDFTIPGYANFKYKYSSLIKHIFTFILILSSICLIILLYTKYSIHNITVS